METQKFKTVLITSTRAGGFDSCVGKKGKIYNNSPGIICVGDNTNATGLRSYVPEAYYRYEIIEDDKKEQGDTKEQVVIITAAKSKGRDSYVGKIGKIYNQVPTFICVDERINNVDMNSYLDVNNYEYVIIENYKKGDMKEQSSENKLRYVKEIEAEFAELASAFKAAQRSQYELFCVKQKSYGLQNICIDVDNEKYQRRAMVGLVVRLNDKIQRLINLVIDNTENPLAGETVSDTLEDIANYATIATLVKDKKWK